MRPPACGRPVLGVEAGQLDAEIRQGVGAEAVLRALVRRLPRPVDDVLVHEHGRALARSQPVRNERGRRNGVGGQPDDVEHASADDELRWP